MLNTSKLLADYSILHVLCALQKGNVFAVLKENSAGIIVQDIATEFSLDSTILEALCDFLIINVPEILAKENEKYILKNFFYDKRFQNTLFFALAYESVFSNTASLLKKEVRYGQDVIRDGEYLGISSALYNERAWDAVIDLLRSMEVSTVVDLGCSIGDFLARVQKNFPRMCSIGVEVDPVAAAIAQETLSSRSDQEVLIIDGDAATPEIWKDSIMQKGNPSGTLFIGITMWHEFLYKGEQHLLDIFFQYRTLFPGSTFVVVEYNGFSVPETMLLPESRRESASVYQLVHPLTQQGLPQSPSKWRGLLEKSGMRLEKTISVYPNTTIYVATL